MNRGGVLALIFAFGWLPLHAFRAEAVTEALPFYSRAERWSVHASIAFLIVHVSVVCLTLTLRLPPPVGRSVLSVALFWGGIGFWMWGRVLIGPMRVSRLPDEPPQRLRRDGAFGLVRHPLYFGVLVAAGAPVMATGQILPVLTFALAAIAVVVRALQEERRLRAQLGPAYDAYCAEVKRLIPFIW